MINPITLWINTFIGTFFKNCGYRVSVKNQCTQTDSKSKNHPKILKITFNFMTENRLIMDHLLVLRKYDEATKKFIGIDATQEKVLKAIIIIEEKVSKCYFSDS